LDDVCDGDGGTDNANADCETQLNIP
jgi:hypothetical protein